MVENLKNNLKKFQGKFRENFEEILTKCDDSYIEDLEIQDLLKSIKTKE